MSVPIHYLVCLRTFYATWYLLWKDGGEKPDSYVTLPRSSSYLLANSRTALTRLALKQGLSVSNQPEHLVDIVGMFQVLTRLRPERPLSESMARMLLESWNALDDMARSIGTSPIPSDKSLKGKAKSIYDKLFYGNNLPSVTPPGEKYRVTLTREELAVLRVVLRHAWSDICDRSAQFKQD